VGHTSEVTEDLVKLECPLQVLAGRAMAVESAVGTGETAMDDRFGVQVSKSLGRRQGGTM
jgi:hypothetical protein